MPRGLSSEWFWCYQYEPSPWPRMTVLPLIILPPAEMTGWHHYTRLCGAGVLTQGFVMLGRSSSVVYAYPCACCIFPFEFFASWTWHRVIMWLLRSPCHVHNLLMCVFCYCGYFPLLLWFVTECLWFGYTLPILYIYFATL